jgi:hypothetical protein
MEVNLLLCLLTGLIPLIIGFIWYNPKVLGTAWMKSINMTEDDMKGANMVLIFGLTYLFGCMISMALYPMVIHQMGFMSSLEGEVGIHDKATEISKYAQQYYDTYGTRFRTFKHGVFHGVLASLFIALPIIGILGLFERRSFKYIAIHVGYWIITLALMAGVICQFA